MAVCLGYSVWGSELLRRSIGAEDGALDVLLSGREAGSSVENGALGIAGSKYAYWGALAVGGTHLAANAAGINVGRCVLGMSRQL